MAAKPDTKSTPAAETETKSRQQQDAAPTHIAYKLDAQGKLVDFAAFGGRKVDREQSKDYALDHEWKVATIPAGVTFSDHIAGGTS